MAKAEPLSLSVKVFDDDTPVVKQARHDSATQGNVGILNVSTCCHFKDKDTMSSMSHQVRISMSRRMTTDSMVAKVLGLTFKPFIQPR